MLICRLEAGMKTARVQVLTTPDFRDWLQREARNAGVRAVGVAIINKGVLPLM